MLDSNVIFYLNKYWKKSVTVILLFNVSMLKKWSTTNDTSILVLLIPVSVFIEYPT